jgi:hypothetical protein
LRRQVEGQGVGRGVEKMKEGDSERSFGALKAMPVTPREFGNLNYYAAGLGAHRGPAGSSPNQRELFPHSSVEFAESIDQSYMSAPEIMRANATRIFTYGTTAQFTVGTGVSDPLGMVFGLTTIRGYLVEHAFIEQTMRLHSPEVQRATVYHEMMHGLDGRMKKTGRMTLLGLNHLLQPGNYFTSDEQSFIEAFNRDVNRQTMEAIDAAGMARFTDPAEAYAQVGATLLQPTNEPGDIAFRTLFAKTIANMTPKLVQLGIIPAPAANTQSPEAPISMTKTPQRGGILYQVDITSLVDDLTITGAELNRGNCVSYVVTSKPLPNSAPKVETIIKEGTQLSERTLQLLSMLNASKVNSINLKFSQMATILYEESCNVLEAKVDTDQGTWTASFNQ